MALAALLAATAARAQQIDVQCDRLSQAEAEELRARARLTLVSDSDLNDGPADGEVNSSRIQALTT